MRIALALLAIVALFALATALPTRPEAEPDTGEIEDLQTVASTSTREKWGGSRRRRWHFHHKHIPILSFVKLHHHHSHTPHSHHSHHNHHSHHSHHNHHSHHAHHAHHSHHAHHRHHHHTPTPTASPTLHPTRLPTQRPTFNPTRPPTHSPTDQPSHDPTHTPTEPPTWHPTTDPTEVPTTLPPTTTDPSHAPTHTPTEPPTWHPTTDPTEMPTHYPTDTPTELPTNFPTLEPTADPTAEPTEWPSWHPTTDPTLEPTTEPSAEPTNDPTEVPTTTEEPSAEPTTEPSAEPTTEPSAEPTTEPSMSAAEVARLAAIKAAEEEAATVAANTLRNGGVDVTQSLAAYNAVASGKLSVTRKASSADQCQEEETFFWCQNDGKSTDKYDYCGDNSKCPVNSVNGVPCCYCGGCLKAPAATEVDTDAQNIHQQGNMTEDEAVTETNSATSEAMAAAQDEVLNATFTEPDADTSAPAMEEKIELSYQECYANYRNCLYKELCSCDANNYCTTGSTGRKFFSACCRTKYFTQAKAEGQGCKR